MHTNAVLRFAQVCPSSLFTSPVLKARGNAVTCHNAGHGLGRSAPCILGIRPGGSFAVHQGIRARLLSAKTGSVCCLLTATHVIEPHYQELY